MKNILGVITFITIYIMVALFSSLALAANDVKIAVVNVSVLYNKSKFVEQANKDLQAHAKTMEETLQVQKNKIQAIVSNYEKETSVAKKKSLAKDLATEQSKLANLTQEYQKKIQEEQNSGLQKFTSLVQTAVAKIAKEKHINSVLNSSSILYSDNTWVDITNDVDEVLQAN